MEFCAAFLSYLESVLRVFMIDCRLFNPINSWNLIPIPLNGDLLNLENAEQFNDIFNYCYKYN